MPTQLFGAAALQSSSGTFLNSDKCGNVDFGGGQADLGIPWWLWQINPAATDGTQFQYALQHKDNGHYLSQLDQKNVSASGLSLGTSETWIIYEAPPQLSHHKGQTVPCRVRLESASHRGQYLTADKSGKPFTRPLPTDPKELARASWDLGKVCLAPIHPPSNTASKGERAKAGPAKKGRPPAGVSPGKRAKS